MKIHSKDKKIDLEVKVADRYFKRLLGLMFKKTPPDYILVLYPCSGIHTFFMNFSIDVLFLDKDFKVMNKISDLKKNRIAKPVKGARYVLEAKVGAFNNIEIGEIMKVEVK